MSINVETVHCANVKMLKMIGRQTIGRQLTYCGQIVCYYQNDIPLLLNCLSVRAVSK